MDPVELLRAVRHLQGWSQRDLAARLDVSKTRVGDWESGRRDAPADVLMSLVTSVGLDLAVVPAVESDLRRAASSLRRSTSQRLLDSLAGRPTHRSKAQHVPVWVALRALARRTPVQLTGVSALGVWLPDLPAPVPLTVRAERDDLGGCGDEALLDVRPAREPRPGGTVAVAVAVNATVEVDGPLLLSLDPDCAEHAPALRAAVRLLHLRAGRDRGGRRAAGHRQPQEAAERRWLGTSYRYAVALAPDVLDSRGWRVGAPVSLDQVLIAEGLPPRWSAGARRDRRLAG